MRRTLTFVWSVDTGRIECATPGEIWFKRGETFDLVLKVSEDGSFTTVAATEDITFTLKPKGSYDQDPLVQVTTWTEDATAKTYTAEVLVDSTQIDTLLAADSEETNDLDAADCVADFLIHDSGTGYDAYSDTIAVTLKNNAGRDADGTPQSTAASDSVWCRQPGAITSLSGFSTSLSAIVTAGSSVGEWVVGNVRPILISDEIQWWVLKSGTQATVSGSYQRPDDYHATSNQKYWKRIA